MSFAVMSPSVRRARADGPIVSWEVNMGQRVDTELRITTIHVVGETWLAPGTAFWKRPVTFRSGDHRCFRLSPRST